jgi:hypothetical protein
MPAVAPAAVVASRDLGDRYTIRLHVDRRRRRLFAWWATITVGIGIPENGVRRARSRERLIARCERYARRDALRRGHVGEPTVIVEGRP